MRKASRQKISTTIAPENSDYLKALIRRGRAANLAEAVDHSISVARHAERRRQLEAATAAFYESLSGAALTEEKRLERAAGSAFALVDFDGE